MNELLIDVMNGYELSIDYRISPRKRWLPCFYSVPEARDSRQAGRTRAVSRCRGCSAVRARGQRWELGLYMNMNLAAPLSRQAASRLALLP